MSELEKFTTCDLLKTFDQLSKHLSKAAPEKMNEIITKYGGAEMAQKKIVAKAEVKDYDPNEKTPKTTVEETTKPPETEASQEKETKVAKDGMMPNGGDEEVSPGTQADVLSQILEAIQDLKAMVAQMGSPEGEQVAPEGEEVQMASHRPMVAKQVKDEKEEEEKEVEKEVSAPVSEHQIASIVVKALDAKLAELGIAKTQKPTVETGHPIEKTAAITMKDIAKMSWNDIHAHADKNRPKSIYEMAYGHDMK